MGRGIVNLEYTNKSKGGYCKNSFHRAGGQNLCGLGAGDCGQDWECEGPLVTFEKLKRKEPNNVTVKALYFNNLP